MTEENIKFYTEFRESLQNVVDKSEDEFEKRLLYVAAGALGLSFSFITDIVVINQCKLLCLLIVGWGLLSLCILINLLSHLWSKNKANKAIDLVDERLISESNDSKLRSEIKRMNGYTRLINNITVWFLFLGIISILSFATINLHKDKTTNKEEIMSDKDAITMIRPDSIDAIQNGRCMPKMKPIVSDTTTIPETPKETPKEK